jgi:predicted site-specific integrase-resolvase
MTGNRMDEDLMTRRQVASLFRVTSASVATWARRGRLPEIRNEAGRPRYRREDVEALFRSGARAGRTIQAAVPGSSRSR